MNEAKTTKKGNTSFFKGVRSEFNKINWPTIENLMKQSWTVIVVSLILGFIIMFIDLIYSYGYNFLLSL